MLNYILDVCSFSCSLWVYSSLCIGPWTSGHRRSGHPHQRYTTFSLNDYNVFLFTFFSLNITTTWYFVILIITNTMCMMYCGCDCNVSFTLQTPFQVTITLGMTDYYMHMGSFGSSNITLWDVPWGEFTLYSTHLSFCPLGNSSADLMFSNDNSYLPYVGWVTIIMTEKPFIKVCLFLSKYWLDCSVMKHWQNKRQTNQYRV
jgi:hypothetical protein